MEELEQFTDWQLFKELEDRQFFLNMPKHDFRMFLCDIVGLSYHASNEEIINLLKEKL